MIPDLKTLKTRSFVDNRLRMMKMTYKDIVFRSLNKFLHSCSGIFGLSWPFEGSEVLVERLIGFWTDA